MEKYRHKVLRDLVVDAIQFEPKIYLPEGVHCIPSPEGGCFYFPHTWNGDERVFAGDYIVTYRAKNLYRYVMPKDWFENTYERFE